MLWWMTRVPCRWSLCRWKVLTDQEHGVYAPGIVKFLFAPSPYEWNLLSCLWRRRVHRARCKGMPGLLRQRIHHSGLTRIGMLDIARARRPSPRWGARRTAK